MSSSSAKIAQVVEAFDRKDYRTAAQLLKTLAAQSPQDPWVQLYIGQLHEVSNRLAKAEATYRQLLRNTTIPKVGVQARQGLQRLLNAERDRRQKAIDNALAIAGNRDPGLLILEPIVPDARPAASQKLARIVEIDPYSARLQLPHRGWKLYRTGTIGELQVYSKELMAAEIPNFCASLTAIQSIRTFRVAYIQSIEPLATIVCQDEQNQLGSLSFDWSEATQRVEGLLPIFEDVLDEGPRRQLTHKVRTQDYSHLFDLHFPNRQCILRFHDHSYQFDQDMTQKSPSEKLNNKKLNNKKSNTASQTTNRINWNNLLALLQDKLAHCQAWSEFVPFAETALEYPEMLSNLNAHIDLKRRPVKLVNREEMLWDPAFHLYSSLIFCKTSHEN